MTIHDTMDINLMHEILGHPHLRIVNRTAKGMGIKLTGELKSCHACALAKARQKNVPKTNKHLSNINGERICIDISYINQKSIGGENFWILIVDEATCFKWSHFVQYKSDLASYPLIVYGTTAYHTPLNFKKTFFSEISSYTTLK